jgi:glc operon protein GlcG
MHGPAEENVIYTGEEEGMYFADSKRLTSAGAKKMVAHAVARAQEAKLAITIAVADSGGHLLLLERMDGGKFHTVHSATTKAVCAASNRRMTGPAGAVGQSLDVQHAIGLALAAGAERWTAMEGGCPILVDGGCVGGIGVAGGSFEFDEKVAREAVEAIGAKAA